ncbi:sulfatase-like hydrolase/transferase [Akkermansiaceae bacterium]|nr:sulfatase-like hydrolase/transferase [Akkermansiaceae bacterium]
MKSILLLATSVASIMSANALVEVDFTHTYTGPPGANQNTGDITLEFSVDGSGNVVLDASCALPGPAAFIDEFDGPVGTVTNPAIRGQNFTIVLSGTGPLRIDNTGGGLAIQGGNPQRLDFTNEAMTFVVSVGAAQFDLRRLAYANATTSPGTAIDVDGSPLALSGASGMVDVLPPGVSGTFVVSSASDTDAQGFVLAGLTFDLTDAVPSATGFDNDSGDLLWTTPSNWNPDGLPVAPSDAVIAGFKVVLASAVTNGPADLHVTDGSLTLRGGGGVSVQSMEIGGAIESEARLVMEGSSAAFGYAGSSPADTFTVGSAGTIETRPDAGGTSPLELGNAALVLDQGSQWILDGRHLTGPFNVGDRFVLANFGSFSGSTLGISTRHFNLPADRKLRLVSQPGSLLFEVVAQTAATGPNIIIVNVDDMVGGEHFGFEGRDCLTPTLDSLAASGIRFTQAFAASTVCGPSRYSLMTGRWASRNTCPHYLSLYPAGTVGRFGVSDTELEEDGQNLGAWLQEAGYRTGFVGKAHLIDDTLNSMSNWPASGLIPYPQNADPATDAGVNGAMRHNHRVLCQRMRQFGFDFVSGYYRANLLELRNEALNVHNQEWITKNALDFIDENHGGKFFLYMAPTINHGPVRNDLTKSLRADPRYTSAGFLPDEDYSFMPSRQSIIDEVVAGNKDLISARETWIDYSMKAITNKLTEHGIRNDTLIIFTADHGEKTLDQVLINNVPTTVWGKSSLFDTGMRVPLVMNWPAGISSPGRTYEENVIQTDFVPTLLELAGAASLPTRPLDGKSLVPVLNGSSASLRDEVFCEIGYARGVRTKKWKYVAVRYTPAIYGQINNGFLWPNFRTGQSTEPRPYYVNNSSLGSLAQGTHPGYFDDDQLYDLTNDPFEQNNLYGQFPAVAHDLKKRLAGYLGEIPARPFRGFANASTEFSPAPTAAPAAPADIGTQFEGVNQIQLLWTDVSNDELGFIVEKSVNGAPFEIIAESPAGSTTTTLPLEEGVEDIVLRVSAYNALGDSGPPNPIDLLSPDHWRFRTFGDIDPDLTSPASQWNADGDGDGQTTLWEYAFATNPRLTSSVARSEVQFTAVGDERFFELKVPRDARRAVQIEGSVSQDLSSWLTGEPACLLVEDEPTHLVFRSASPVGDKTSQFIRALIDAP